MMYKYASCIILAASCGWDTGSPDPKEWPVAFEVDGIVVLDVDGVHQTPEQISAIVGDLNDYLVGTIGEPLLPTLEGVELYYYGGGGSYYYDSRTIRVAAATTTCEKRAYFLAHELLHVYERDVLDTPSNHTDERLWLNENYLSAEQFMRTRALDGLYCP